MSLEPCKTHRKRLDAVWQQNSHITVQPFTKPGLERLLYLDVVRVCEEHGQAVDAHAPPSRGWQTVLQRCAECLVHEHGLVVTLRLGLVTSMHIQMYLPQTYMTAFLSIGHYICL